jgi:uncharacterized spore protein YtfJ
VNFKKQVFYDDIIVGKSKKVNSLVFIPVYKVSFNTYSGLGLGVDGIIEPMAFIVVDENNIVSFYKFTNKNGLLEIIKTITKKNEEE